VRAVVDTNVLVSGFLWGGPPNRLIETFRSGAGVLVASRTLVEEFGRTLRKPDLQTRLARAGITAPIVSATNLEQLSDLIASVELKLDQPSVELLNQASAYSANAAG